ncbi:unnamed protein product [Periconia digitata]|uniref:Ubiquitin carboxyl-terminal hydrolase n=1 Tax=Periconia digitata TaxID=1303443 RepID=A0A9W4UHZ7_9PLEO|nr:unnamed protein product [Periconia digitata]
MMPGPHIPPAGPHHPGRRPNPYADHQYMPPQAHSPVHHNPYAAYHHPQHYAPPHASPYPPQMQQHMQQWYNPYHQPHPHQYAMPPRQFQPQPQPHGSPVVVSSHPHMAHMPPPVNRAMGHTPPIVHSRTPPALQRMSTPHRTPQQAPSTPSVHSQPPVASSSSPPANLSTPTPPPTTPSMSSVVSTPALQPGTYLPYYPELPWKSFEGDDFPARASQKKRRRRAPVPAQEQGLALPSRELPVEGKQDETVVEESEKAQTEEPEDSQASTVAAASEREVDTPSTSHPPSENELTHAAPVPSAEAVKASHTRSQTKPAVPLIPIRSAKAPSVASTTQKSAKSISAEQESPKAANGSAAATAEGAQEAPKAAAAPKQAPSSWAALLRKNAPAPVQAAPATNGVLSPTNAPPPPTSNSLGDVLASFSVDSDKKLSFLEPRGLVNTGNLCYMNSILQMLVFCVPFYDFLDQVAKRAVHSFKSETPLVDAMIMFMRDFKVIDSASSAEKLRLRLKDTELEQYGEPLTPEYVYDVIKRLPRFDNMKRGQQEDAEEFLGFLLAGLHDECAQVIKSSRSTGATENVPSPKSERSGSIEGEWLEVGPKQKSAITQSSGAIEFESPLTKMFGGKIRSEYRKPGEKPSVTLEPYQPLQLDIGSPDINSIADALKGLTRLETLDSATRGGRASTKQMFIETLPPVLILHLKRFHYDANGPQKIWKKIGYPLELEIPKEVFAPHMRGLVTARGGLPRYRLTGVVYHHGKNASGGHYTTDLRRQDGREWIRMDDTVIRRIRADEVAEGGAEEDPKVLAEALEQHKNDTTKSKNMYEQIGIGEYGEEADKGGWSKVNGSEKSGSKKLNGLVNGAATPNSAGKRTPLIKENVRDNKVAYILFYERIHA